MDIFGFELEFNHDTIRKKIEDCSKEHGKGYVCIVDGPSLVRSHTNQDFLHLLQGAYFNSCDGGSVAAMAGRLYKQELKAFTGPEIFAEYITQTGFRQVLLGNTEKMFEKVVEKVKQEVQEVQDNSENTYLFHIPLPFCEVEDFDYEGIAKEIGHLDADIIWVSLGAPKQEFFMQKLLPYLDRGLMLGVGAAFAFYLGELKDYTFRIGEYRFNWIYRLFVEPKKQIARVRTIFRYYPQIYLKERKRING